MTHLRVATWNVYLGADLSLLFDVGDLAQLAERVAVVRDQLERTRFAERARAVAAVLARERPDLVGLQEVSRWTAAPLLADGSMGQEQVLVDFLPALLDALEAAGCGYDVVAREESFSGAMPVSGTTWMSLVGSNAVLVRRDGPVEVVAQASAVFTESHRVMTGIEGLSFPVARSWGRVDVRLEGRPLRLVNTHTEAWDAPTRDAQRDELLAANEVDVPTVVVGDLNAAPDEVGMPTGWTDAWGRRTGGCTSGRSADLADETGTLDERIDYVLVRGLSVRSCRVVGDQPGDRTTPHGLWPSDHACVVADLDLP